VKGKNLLGEQLMQLARQKLDGMQAIKGGNGDENPVMKKRKRQKRM
jgi:hypothetical protein